MLSYFRCIQGKIEAHREFSAEMLAEFPDALHWIDLEAPTLAEAAILGDPFRSHPPAIEGCRAESRQPQGDDFEAYIFIILHGIRFDAPTDEFITRELDIFLGKSYLVTHHSGPMRSISWTREQCGKNLLTSFPRGVDFLCHQILDQMF